MSGLGLRSGALGTLVIKGNAFNCVSKGKELSDTIPDALLAFLKRWMRRKKLFVGIPLPAMKKSLNSHIERLFKRLFKISSDKQG